jgi:MFS family permease
VSEPAFRGWWIVAVAFLAQGIVIGLTIIPYGFFATPITEEFGVSLGTYQSGLAMLTLVMTGVGVFVGRMLDRHSIRVSMALGLLLLAVSYLGMSFATALWQLGLGFGVGAAAAVSMAGPLPATTVIAKWFERKRGRAVGIASMGIPLFAFVLMPLTSQWITAFGWRTTLQIFAGISFSIVPLVLAIVRNSPEAVGQHVDGEPPGDADERGEITEAGAAWSTGDLLGSRNFWALALGVGIVFGIGGGWNANAPRFGEDLGYATEYIGRLFGLAALLGLPATFVFGALADRFDNRILLVTAVALQGSGLALLWAAPTDLGFAAGVLLFGFGGGALMPVYASLIGRLFGANSFGSVMGLAGLVMLPFGAAAPILAGSLRDASGDYSSALLIFVCAFVVGAVLMASIRLGARGAGTHV